MTMEEKRKHLTEEELKGLASMFNACYSVLKTVTQTCPLQSFKAVLAFQPADTLK
jgi:hypothetical protein